MVVVNSGPRFSFLNVKFEVKRGVWFEAGCYGCYAFKMPIAETNWSNRAVPRVAACACCALCPHRMIFCEKFSCSFIRMALSQTHKLVPSLVPFFSCRRLETLMDGGLFSGKACPELLFSVEDGTPVFT